MLFTGYWFVGFMLVLLPVYWLTTGLPGRRIVITIASIIFYLQNAGFPSLAMMSIMAMITFLAAKSRNSIFIAVAIVVNLLFLFLFKYFIESLFLASEFLDSDYLRREARMVNSIWEGISVPLGISFFVFEFLHVLVDSGRGRLKIESSFAFFSYALFFPTVACGPIKRYKSYQRQLLKVPPTASLDDLRIGLARIFLGFAKKLIFVDLMTSYISRAQPTFDALPRIERWEILYMIGLRFFLDFSAYSDIAIGVSSMLGIKIPENFRQPYLAVSIQDFWRRWHISLSTWIRDYVYAFLRGENHGLIRRNISVLLAFFACGLWHGAHWNYIFWGAYNGIGLLVSTILGDFVKRFIPINRVILLFLGWVLTQTFVCCGAVYFFYPMNVANRMLIALLPV